MSNGVLSILTGIIAVICSVIGYSYPYIFFPIMVILAIISIINGNSAIRDRDSQTSGIFGLIFSGAAIVISIVYLIMAIL